MSYRVNGYVLDGKRQLGLALFVDGVALFIDKHTGIGEDLAVEDLQGWQCSDCGAVKCFAVVIVQRAHNYLIDRDLHSTNKVRPDDVAVLDHKLEFVHVFGNVNNATLVPPVQRASMQQCGMR